jgi:molecular chaperone HtpG
VRRVTGEPAELAVKLHLKPDDSEDELHHYTSEPKIRALVKQYSGFIAWPIRMQVERRWRPRKVAKGSHR